MSETNIFYQKYLTWPLWTWGKTMTLICLFSNKIFLPAFVFIGLEQEDCCGCCGHDNCGKRCAVGPPALVETLVFTPLQDALWLTPSVSPPLDAFFCAGISHRNCRVWLLCHCGSSGLSGRTTLSWFLQPVELYLFGHWRTVSNCSVTDHTFLFTTRV